VWSGRQVPRSDEITGSSLQVWSAPGVQPAITQPLRGEKQVPGGQAQIETVWLFAGAQPHAPTLQLFGKSPVAWQHSPASTAPPVTRQRSAGPASAPPSAHRRPPLQSAVHAQPSWVQLHAEGRHSS
jgi:hypothetical protein